MCDTYNCNYPKHSTFGFNLMEIQLNRDFPSQFCFFYRKITFSVTQRSVSQENTYNKELKPVAFSSQNYRLR